MGVVSAVLGGPKVFHVDVVVVVDDDDGGSCCSYYGCDCCCLVSICETVQVWL